MRLERNGRRHPAPEFRKVVPVSREMSLERSERRRERETGFEPAGLKAQLPPLNSGGAH